MRLLYPTLGALAILAVFTALIWRQNRDLLRVGAYREFFLRMIPPLSTGVFVAGLPFVMDLATVENYLPVLLVYLGGAAILTALMTRAVTPEERRANGVFRRGDYPQAAELYGKLVQEKPLARNHAFHGAALGASERYDESVNASTKAIATDPEYGLAYYNRALVLRRMNKRTKAVKDLNKALEADMPRRFRSAAKKILGELN